jgi:hypothetical protein
LKPNGLRKVSIELNLDFLGLGTGDAKVWSDDFGATWKYSFRSYDWKINACGIFRKPDYTP